MRARFLILLTLCFFPYLASKAGGNHTTGNGAHNGTGLGMTCIFTDSSSEALTVNYDTYTLTAEVFGHFTDTCWAQTLFSGVAVSGSFDMDTGSFDLQYQNPHQQFYLQSTPVLNQESSEATLSFSDDQCGQLNQTLICTKPEKSKNP